MRVDPNEPNEIFSPESTTAPKKRLHEPLPADFSAGN